jgi:prolyl oligopeptidase
MKFIVWLVLAAAPVFSQKAPETRRQEVTETLHGVRITDPYRWLEDQNSPETRAWIEAQNAYSRPLLDKVAARAKFRRRVGELMRVDQASMPVERGGRYFYLRRGADQDQASLVMRRDGKDEVLVDPAALSPDHKSSLSLLSVTADGKLVAYGIRRGGQDEVTVRLLDVDARKELPDRMERGRYQVSLKPDHSGFFYTTYRAGIGQRIRYHAMGGGPAQDRLIFGEGYGPEMGMGADVTEDGRWLVVEVVEGSAGDNAEIWVADLKAGGAARPVVKGLGAHFTPVAGGDTLFVQTDWKAPNGRVLAIDLLHPEQTHWREVVPAGPDPIQAIAVAGGRFVVEYLHNVTQRLVVFAPDGRRAGEIALPSDAGAVSALSGEWSKPDLFYRFESFAMPVSIRRYAVGNGKQDVWWRATTPVDSARFEVRQIWYASKDGTRVPMFVIYRKGLKLDGSHPTLVTGYGGFDISDTPAFNPRAVAWAEAGGVFALANLRGGSEFGEAWHKAGMLANKQNVFDDFIAAAEALVKQGYTQPARLGIFGRSNGGLLVGAALTQRPDLFRAVVCGYPLFDMLRYQKFLVACWWTPEYGSSDNAAQFKYLYEYSPYQHVRTGVKYPAVLFVTGDGDTRVAPLHARKMTALLQASSASGLPVLLAYDTEAGHSAGMPVGKQIDEAVDELSFFSWQLGLN